MRKIGRSDIVVFQTPQAAMDMCGASGKFVKRLIGLPGETVSEKEGFVYINGKRLEALWIATRAGVYGCVPMLVAIAFGLDPSWGMLTVPLIAWLAGFGWACFGIMIAGFASSFENFNYVVSAVLTPLFLVAGTFFPINRLPRWAQILAEGNPLHHCVELVRHAVFGFEGWTDLARVGALVTFGLIVWRIGIYAMERKLID